MSNRHHNKWHRHNHHTTSAYPNEPDAAYDPIASPADPFRGDFCVVGAISAQGTIPVAGTFNSYTADSYLITLSGDVVTNGIPVSAYDTFRAGVCALGNWYGGFFFAPAVTVYDIFDMVGTPWAVFAHGNACVTGALTAERVFTDEIQFGNGTTLTGETTGFSYSIRQAPQLKSFSTRIGGCAADVTYQRGLWVMPPSSDKVETVHIMFDENIYEDSANYVELDVVRGDTFGVIANLFLLRDIDVAAHTVYEVATDYLHNSGIPAGTGILLTRSFVGSGVRTPDFSITVSYT